MNDIKVKDKKIAVNYRKYEPVKPIIVPKCNNCTHAVLKVKNVNRYWPELNTSYCSLHGFAINPAKLCDTFQSKQAA